MGRPAITRVCRALPIAAAFLLLLAAPAVAHNSFVRSVPADGAELEDAPKRVTLVFAKAVPLETIQVVLVQASGARRQAEGFAHGQGGEREVRVPLGPVEPGPLTLRWRLVNSDGHVVSGRVRLAIAAAPETATGATQGADTAVAAPATTPPPAEPDAPVAGEPQADAAAGEWSTPDPVRWALRLLSFLAMVVVTGAIVTAWRVWPGAAAQPRLRWGAGLAALVVAVVAVVQLLLLASDLTGEQPLAAWEGVDPALSLDAGRAFAARAVLGVALALLVVAPGGARARWPLAAALAVAAFATWAFAGHASSQRWPWVGVPVDVVHHAAAAAWLGALGMLAVIVFRAAPLADLVDAVQRFSLVAATAVAAIVATGIVQSLRLVGDPAALVETTHGRVLLGKVLLLGVMLYIADLNRRRVRSRFRRPETVTLPARRVLQRAILTEAGIGAAVLAVTAVLVVQTPGTAADDASGAAAGARPVILHRVVVIASGGAPCADCPSPPPPSSSHSSASPRVAATTTSTSPQPARRQVPARPARPT